MRISRNLFPITMAHLLITESQADVPLYHGFTCDLNLDSGITYSISDEGSFDSSNLGGTWYLNASTYYNPYTYGCVNMAFDYPDDKVKIR